MVVRNLGLTAMLLLAACDPNVEIRQTAIDEPGFAMEDVVRLSLVEQHSAATVDMYFGLDERGELTHDAPPDEDLEVYDPRGRVDEDNRLWRRLGVQTDDGVPIWHVTMAGEHVAYVAVSAFTAARGDRVLVGSERDDGTVVMYVLKWDP